MKNFVAALAALLTAVYGAKAEPGGAVEADGTLHVPAYSLPLTDHLSREAKAALIEKLRQGATPAQTGTPAPSITAVRKQIADGTVPAIKRLRTLYAVDIAEKTIGGVHAMEVIPKTGTTNGRVLVNLHGGGFNVGAAADIGLLESIPIAALGRVRVITLDYRQGPEHQFPAASIDVAAVYKALLKTYPASGIGIYGCSAGGLLSAQAVAWIDREKLPRPGAIGIFCASADAAWAGETLYSVPPKLGLAPRNPKAPMVYDEQSYYGAADLKSPLMSPVVSPELLAKFPPTLLITATRADEMSAAIDTHRQLVKAGAEAELHVWDGLWHGFFVGTPDIPESQEAYSVIVNFFDRHLTRDTP